MIEFRRAAVEDMEQLIRMRIEFMKEVNNIPEDSDDADIRESLNSYFKDSLKSGAFVAWLAVDDGWIVGTSGMCFYALPPSFRNISGRVAYIMNMYTVPEYRGKGIAGRLFEKLLEEAKSRGYKKVSLHATAMGKPLYMKFGFKEADGEMALNLG